MRINNGLPALYQNAVPATRTPRGNAVPPTLAPTARSGNDDATRNYRTVEGGSRLSNRGSFAEFLTEGDLSPTARRALAAYGETGTQDERNYLTQALGIDVYA
jgi:hypothetical protein